jgi:geranylgeranyl diphosphate synthase, type II
MAADDRFALVEKLLDHYRKVTVDAMLEFVATREPRRHLYDLVPLYPLRGGKGLRPGLCIGTCRAFGGNVQSALASAVAIELFHNAFLIHDDVEDGSEFRRGLPTMHTEHGLAIAVNVGDAMNVMSIRPLMDNRDILGPELAWRIFAEIEHMVRQSVEGQAMELGWVRDNDCELTTDDYLRMTLKKTCWYTCIHPCRIGALIGSRGRVDPDRFNRFGYYMGAAFQIQDDVLNLVGDPDKYGKEIGGDIREGKRTMMLIHALQNCTPAEKKRMRVFLATPRERRSDADVAWVYEIMHRYGSIEFARSSARQLAGAALREFFVAYRDAPESDDKYFVRDIVFYMIERDL